MGMKHIYIVAQFLLASPLTTFAQRPSENYIQTTERISYNQTKTSVQYYDGLGRLKEEVELEVTPQGSNLVRHYQYDGLGRENKIWLPVVTGADYVSDVSSSAQSQYDDAHAYTESTFDGTPLDRPFKVQGPGEKWNNHCQQTEYLVNTTSFPLSCKYYRVSIQGTLQEKGIYQAGRLYVTKVTDEDGNESYEFKNLSGNIVLRRVLLSKSESADTYYIYDIRGNLAYVLPPNYQDEPDLGLYAYQYKYDGRGNCVWKKLPGVEPVSMVYDRSHHMVYLQDGNLRKQRLWKFFVSDQMGRPVVAGLTASTSNIANTQVYARYTGTGSLDGYQVYGTSIPVHSYLTTNYYDDYTFLSHFDASVSQQLQLDVSKALETVFPSTSAPNAKGYLTGKKVYLTDGSGKSLFSSYYYGRQGRVVQSHSSNAQGGWEQINTSYTYAGSPLKKNHVHTAEGKRSITENYRYEYDHAGRLTQTKYSLDGNTERVLSSISYDEYGRASVQNILDKENVAHTYNLRSWPSTIESNNLKLRYVYNEVNGNLYPMKTSYVGNIASMSWQVGNQKDRAFFFYYNTQNMLTNTYYGEGEHFSDARNRYTEYLSYDKIGNILSLQRSGLCDDNEYGVIDDLDYTYIGNQLEKVDDAVKGPYYAGAFHFVDGANEDVEYTYDANGNMTKDANKGISSIQYDVNDQPRKIAFSDGRSAEYVYDAEGNKLAVNYNLTSMTSTLPQMPVMQSQDVVAANSANGEKTLSYCGNVIYDGTETTILNDVGYALYDQSGNLSFHYYLKDHLGNNRLVLNENGEVEQVNDYYPSGALMGSSNGGGTQRYKYNSKELDRLNGLDWYDYEARNYDATLGVWHNMDKLAEKDAPHTLYGYCRNNFVNAIDPDGKRIVLVGDYEERMAMLQHLQKLTNDKLQMNRKTGVVSLSGKPSWITRKQNLTVGTGLVRDVIANKHTLTIKKSDDANQETAKNISDGRIRGKGTDATINFNAERRTEISVAGKNGKATKAINVAYSALGHEMIHGLRDMEGVSSKTEYVSYTFKDWKGNIIEDLESKEELMTTGILKKDSYKYTENQIRKEHGLPVRVSY